MYTEALYTQPIYESIRKFSGTKFVYLFDYWLNYTTQNIGGYYPIRLGRIVILKACSKLKIRTASISHHNNFSFDHLNEIFAGISHSDDLYLIFYHEESAPNLTKEDFAMSDEIITRLVNFIYSGLVEVPLHIPHVAKNFRFIQGVVQCEANSAGIFHNFSAVMASVNFSGCIRNCFSFFTLQNKNW